MKPSISQEQLKIWKIFRDVGPEGEEILKLAKLAHVANEKEAFVVTTADETYSFFREDDGVCKVSKIPELCRVQVKEFVTGSISLALTEDGRVYSWCNNFTPGAVIRTNLRAQLGHFPVSHRVTDPNFIGRPDTVKHTNGEKVVQVALSEVEKGCAVALTAGGDVIHWGPHNWDRDAPILIPNAKFDGKELISVLCGVAGMSFALSEDGQIFQWKLDADSPTKPDTCTAPIKTIAATRANMYLLTVEGSLYVCWSVPAGILRKAAGEKYGNVQDIATCRTGTVLVVEWKTGTRHGWDMATKKPSSLNSASVDEYFADLCQTSHRTIGMPGPIRPVQKGTLGQDMWRSKDDVDVTFSVEGKTITAHKLILKTRSDYFAKMFSNEWKEACTKFPIKIKDTKYVTFEAFLLYIYHDKVTFPVDEYERIFDLMKLSDSYCATNIARECEKILIRGINAENAFFLARNASSANAEILEGKVIKFIVDQRIQLNLKNSSLPDLIELIGQDAFNKVAMVLLRRD